MRQNHDKNEIKARFYCILLYQFILSKEKNLFLLGFHANTHSRQILVNFEDIEAILVVVSYKNGQKSVFLEYFTVLILT